MMRTVVDFETRSAADLKKVGPYKYSMHPTTAVTCMAIKTRSLKKVHLLKFDSMALPWKLLPQEFRVFWKMCLLGKLVAHNAFFERCIYTNVLVRRLGWPEVRPDQWICTAARAAACALPRALQGVGEVLDLAVQKDKGGMIAMMRTCRPSREWNAWNKKRSKTRWVAEFAKDFPEPGLFISPESHPEVFEDLYRYCATDAIVEEKLDQVLPDLSPEEHELWLLNQEMNWRGVRVDLPLVHKIVGILEVESKLKLRELDELTMGLITKPGARAAILEFLAVEGTILPDIRANTVQDALEGGKLSETGKQLLELRKVLSKTSTRKYQAFVDRADPEDHRVRDILMFHGASTGRDSGTGLQVQNFPRPVIPIDKARPYAPVENARECDPEMLKILYGDNLSLLFSSILRNMILASPGKTLFVADFSKIEVAVGWWLACNQVGIEILRAGGDPYKRLASMNTGIPYEEIDDDGEDRQLAKRQILGCMYGMGWEKFQRTAIEQDRLHLSDEQSKVAVRQYRETFPRVPAFWRVIERAAISATRVPGRRVRFPHGAFIVENSFLWMELPSARRIAYRHPEITWKVSEYNGEEQESLSFQAVNSRTKKWGHERTWGGVLMENMTQAVSRDLMMRALPRLERAGYTPLLTVHDEVVAEAKTGSMEDFIRILCEPPVWADSDLLIEAKGYSHERYRK